MFAAETLALVRVSAVLVVLTRTSVFPLTSMYATLWAFRGRLPDPVSLPSNVAIPPWELIPAIFVKSILSRPALKSVIVSWLLGVESEPSCVHPPCHPVSPPWRPPPYNPPWGDTGVTPTPWGVRRSPPVTCQARLLPFSLT
jgi:hypothetical protein